MRRGSVGSQCGDSEGDQLSPGQMCMAACACCRCEKPGAKLLHAGQRAVSRGGGTRASAQAQSQRVLPLLQGRPFRMYLTLRVLSSLDQESVEGKEGRDEEEVTSALLPIWKWREKQAWEKIKQTSPHLPRHSSPKSHSLLTAVAQGPLRRQAPAGNHSALKRPLVLKEKIPQPS